VKVKCFVFRSEVSEGVRLAKRSKGVFRAVVLGWPSVIWLLKVFTKGKDLRENWRTFRQGNTAYVVQH
jgi:hypothetical protein